MNDNQPPSGDITEKNHPYREIKSRNRLSLVIHCPFNEAIIDENRLETALRDALGVPDLIVNEVLWIAAS